jgi:DNA-binding LacI/PurR family transcriptional regulator
MVSIKDVAKDCEVSIATVSKAINDHGDVSEKTKRKVMESVKKLGYHPNSQARFLKTNKTFNIGVVYEDKAGGGLTHQFFSVVLNSFKAEIEKFGFDLTFISSQVGIRNKMTYYDHCRFRNVDGVVVVCADFNDVEIQRLMNSDIPLVAIDYKNEKVCSVLSDNSQGLSSLVNCCFKKGHKKIAYIYGDKSQVTDVRLATFKAAMQNLELELSDNYVREGKYHDPDVCEEIVTELLKSDNPPTCIICPDDYAAMGAYNAVSALNLKIPADISIAGYDGIKLSEIIKPHITTFRQNAKLIGERAASLLKTALDRKGLEEFERIITVKGELVSGDTIKDLNAV